MRQLSTTILLIFALGIITTCPAISAVKGGIEYSIPVYYTKLSEPELNLKAETYFDSAINQEDKDVSEETTNALMLYTVLQNINPENIDYSIRLGRLYDKIGKDRYAKGNFSRAIGINQSMPEPYFYFGEYYYNRQLYRKALKYYKEAYDRGMTTNSDLLSKLNDIYEKLGDSASAIKYTNTALEQDSSNESENSIQEASGQNTADEAYDRGIE